MKPTLTSLVTVIVPTHNSKWTAPLLLRDLSRQTSSRGLQIIIVDNGSTDYTPQHISRLAQIYENLSIRVLSVPPTTRGHNEALSLVTTPYVILAEPDTRLLHGETLSQTVAALQKSELASAHITTLNWGGSTAVYGVYNLINELMSEFRPPVNLHWMGTHTHKLRISGGVCQDRDCNLERWVRINWRPESCIMLPRRYSIGIPPVAVSTLWDWLRRERIPEWH